MRHSLHESTQLLILRLEHCLELAVRMLDGQKLLREISRRIETCPDCDGSGLAPRTEDEACRNCGGQGKVLPDITGLIGDIEDAAKLTEAEERTIRETWADLQKRKERP